MPTSSASLRSFVENAPASLAMLDRDMVCVAASPRWVEEFGGRDGDAIGRSFYDLCQDMPARWRDAHTRSLGGESLHFQEDMWIRADGTVHWLDWSTQPWRAADGSIVGLIVLLENVTARRRAVEAMREASEFSRQVIAGAHEGIVVFDRKLRYLVFNPFMEEITRWKAATILGRRVDDVLSPPESDDVIERLKRSLAGEVVHSEDSFVPESSSSPGRWITTKSAPLRNADGQVVGVIVTIGDITERKRAEEEIRQLNADLERRVALRTAQLEASNKELEAFAYSVSHDLRAPLRAINGFSRILVEDHTDRLDSEGLRLLDIVGRNARQMDLLISDLLSLSRVTRSEMKFVTVDMTELARSSFHDAAAPEELARFEFVLDPLPEVEGDPGLLRQVWRNLLSNAVKYTAPSAVRRVHVSHVEKDGASVFSVSDTGAGFDAAYAGKLFNAFQRLHTAAEFEGTGIGLAIVGRIVRRHGGQVWAEAEVNKGATFRFSIPRMPSSP